MDNVVSFHPVKSDLSLLWEVVEADGETRWGGASALDAMEWFKLAPAGSRLLVMAFEGEGEDDLPVGQPIDVTDLIGAVRDVYR